MRTFSLRAVASQLAQASGSLEMTVALVKAETDGSSCPAESVPPLTDQSSVQENLWVVSSGNTRPSCFYSQK